MKRNPQDVTLRNLRATKKRERTLKERVASLEANVASHDRQIEMILRELRK